MFGREGRCTPRRVWADCGGCVVRILFLIRMCVYTSRQRKEVDEAGGGPALRLHELSETICASHI